MSSIEKEPASPAGLRRAGLAKIARFLGALTSSNGRAEKTLPDEEIRHRQISKLASEATFMRTGRPGSTGWHVDRNPPIDLPNGSPHPPVCYRIVPLKAMGGLFSTSVEICPLTDDQAQWPGSKQVARLGSSNEVIAQTGVPVRFNPEAHEPDGWGIAKPLEGNGSEVPEALAFFGSNSGVAEAWSVFLSIYTEDASLVVQAISVVHAGETADHVRALNAAVGQ